MSALDLGVLPEKTPWQQGHDAFHEGRNVPLPTADSTWATRLRNAGWCAARREFYATQQAPQRA